MTMIRDHGGGIDAAVAAYGGVRANWLGHLVATDRHHAPAARFRLDRFNTGLVMDEEAKGSQHNLH